MLQWIVIYITLDINKSTRKIQDSWKFKYCLKEEYEINIKWKVEMSWNETISIVIYYNT